jgi:hypothetical protein
LAAEYREGETVAIGHFTEEGGAEAAQAKGEAEEEAGHGAQFAGDELPRINKDGGESGGEDEADDRAQDDAPKEVRVGKREGERRDAEDRDPDDGFPPDAVAD